MPVRGVRDSSVSSPPVTGRLRFGARAHATGHGARRRGLQVNCTAGERAARFALAPVAEAYLAACEAAVRDLIDDDCVVKTLWVFAQFARGAVRASITGGTPGVGEMASAIFRGVEMLGANANASLEDMLSKPLRTITLLIEAVARRLALDRAGRRWTRPHSARREHRAICRL